MTLVELVGTLSLVREEKQRSIVWVPSSVCPWGRWQMSRGYHGFDKPSLEA